MKGIRDRDISAEIISNYATAGGALWVFARVVAVESFTLGRR
ncbi:hypothetical protein [Pyrobaculum sp.]